MPKMSFIMMPYTSLMGAIASEYLGLFNASTNRKSYNHLFVVEFDTNYNVSFKENNNNHVGVDLNSLKSVDSQPAATTFDTVEDHYILSWSFSTNIFLTVSILAIFCWLKRSRQTEFIKEWELKFWPHRIPYRELSIATKGFKEEQLLSSGGFGKVYKGVLPIRIMSNFQNYF
eukprot:Gb_06860 [translate_table: standard]